MLDPVSLLSRTHHSTPTTPELMVWAAVGLAGTDCGDVSSDGIVGQYRG